MNVSPKTDITVPSSSSSSSSSSLLKDDSEDVQDAPATGDASSLGETSDNFASAAASDHQRATEESSGALFFVDNFKNFIYS
jgi:hypothetical protein